MTTITHNQTIEKRFFLPANNIRRDLTKRDKKHNTCRSSWKHVDTFFKSARRGQICFQWSLVLQSHITERFLQTDSRRLRSDVSKMRAPICESTVIVSKCTMRGISTIVVSCVRERWDIVYVVVLIWHILIRQIVILCLWIIWSMLWIILSLISEILTHAILQSRSIAIQGKPIPLQNMRFLGQDYSAKIWFFILLTHMFVTTETVQRRNIQTTKHPRHVCYFIHRHEAI